ncbi:MAG: SusE domain-containing protein [Bacteroidota bacterium]
MKHNIIKTTALLVLVSLFACEKVEKEPVAGLLESPAMQEPGAGSDYILTEATAVDTMATFKWSKADYGFQAATTYILEMDVAGNNFTAPVVLGTTTDLAAAVTVGDMNNIMSNVLSLGPDVAHDMEVRVISTLHETLDTAYSDVLAISVTPYYFEVVYPVIYVPGSHQGWDPAGAPNLAAGKFDDKYEGYVWFADANTEFKFTKEGNWDLNWGDDSADGTLDQDGANILAAEAGYYKFNVNLVLFTYEMMKTDWGLIGDATPDGWDSDQDMTYDDVNGVMTITLDLVEGEMKFRANDDWALNYGSNDANGFLQKDGGNIPVTAGNYTITLDLSNAPVYTYTVVKN